MEDVIWIAFCILGLPLGVGLLIGWLAWGRGRTMPPGGGSISAESHEQWLLQQIDREPIRSLISADQREEFRAIYAPDAVQTSRRPREGADITTSVPSREPIPSDVPSEIVAPADDFTEAEIGDEIPPSPLGSNTPKDARAIRDPLDPAALMLYAGAFLVVAAGLVYSAYNWADLAAWQKTGMLAAFTIAFAATGWLLLDNRRVRQAAETLVAVSALLIPANAVAVWTVIQQREASTAIIVAIGATVTSAVYAAFSIRPGGVIYRVGATAMMWLAIGALPSAIGFHWGWGAPLVIGTVGLLWAFPRDLPLTLRHLGPSLQTTALVALAVAVGVGVGALDTTPWQAPVTLITTTLALGAAARTRRLQVWGVATTIAGCLSVTSIITTLDSPSAWTLALVPLTGALVLIAIGERGPDWLRTPTVCLAVHVEALIALLIAVAGAEGLPWLRVAVLLVAVAATAGIARLRDARWWLLATGIAAILLWAAIAAAIGYDRTWTATGVVVFVALFVLIASIAAYAVDRLSEQSHRPAWGEPLWLTAESAAVFIPVFILTNQTFGYDNAPWLVLAAIGLIFAGLTFVASWSVDRPLVRILAGLWTVAAALSASLALDFSVADRLPLLAALLLALLGINWLLFGGSDSHPRLPRLSPRRTKDPRLERPVLSVAAGLVLVGMMMFTVRYISTTAESQWVDAPSIRWTWIIYTAIFLLLTIGLGAFSIRLGARPARAIWRSGPAPASLATVGASVFLVFSTLLSARTITTNPWVPMLALTLVAWVLLTTTITRGSKLRLHRVAPWWQRISLAIGVLAVLHPISLGSPWQNGERQVQIVVVALVSLSGLVALVAWIQRSRLQAIVASAIAMLALLLQIGLQEPANVLAFSLPLGVYLLALGTTNRRTPHLRDGLLGASAGVLLLPSLWLAQQEDQVGYLLLAGALALSLFLGGTVLRLRVLIAAGLLGLTVIVLRLLVDAVLALQSWVALLVVGLILIVGGTAALIWNEALRDRLTRLQRTWHEMG